MSADRPPLLARVMTWLVVAMTVILLALGISWYGWSNEIHNRFWGDIFGRLHGPMTFRFFLQPTMALLAALPDGIRDARKGHSAFFWIHPGDPEERHGRLRQGLTSTARVVLLGISMDIIYQHRMFEHFYPVEALMMALLLALIPYFIFRWAIELFTGWWLPRRKGG